MNLILFAHPTFHKHQSMPRFARMLADGMRARGHTVELWTAKGILSTLTNRQPFKKWLGYIDQFLLFPRKFNTLLKKHPDTLFVFTDQALGPWVPALAHRPHVIHCHDFLALQSALGEIPKQKTQWTGRQYQKFIRKGFSKGKHFISVSEKTKADLSRLLLSPAVSSHVVYNGFHQSFTAEPVSEARAILSRITGLDLSAGYILHVGGNAWYKNRQGVIEIYNAWRMSSKSELPMLFVGEPPTAELLASQQATHFAENIHWVSGVSDENVRHAYSGATVLLFPSWGEGFGWPIAEAMASGTLVITTGEAPMSEVAGDAGFLISRKPEEPSKVTSWAISSAGTLEKVVKLTSEERAIAISKSLANASRFNTNDALNRIEAIYQRIIQESSNQAVTE